MTSVFAIIASSLVIAYYFYQLTKPPPPLPSQEGGDEKTTVVREISKKETVIPIKIIFWGAIGLMVAVFALIFWDYFRKKSRYQS